MFKVYLSPSTQEKNIGFGTYGTEEKEMNLIADVVEKELERHGITVYRNTPDMNVVSAVKDSNAKSPDLHMAIHSNACNTKARGCEVFCYTPACKGAVLANNIYKYMAPLTPTSDRGVKKGEDFYGPGKHMYEVAYTIAPAALVEVDYHDNPESAVWIMTHRENIGVAITKGILDTLGVKYQAPVVTKSKAEMAVEAAFKAGLINEKSYWLNVLLGNIEVKPEYLIFAFLNAEK